ncbi:MAG: ATP-dependent RNA helicase RhlE [Nitrospirae bacterium]|nr:MAG: ATP-dependent RNA helicase [Nitrospira sp. OLB3]MBV6470407.1 ATP-dependent RNA helicase RhlE [Nitrospirota bacterium]MCE7965887.1 DEAD/DEAH box helicase [Nitrospira sp. NTP2]MCK6501215.1 DEAD/DEAH box helicase [Nitrospira sp.]MEB2339592.1 DEAD/DEAH box helicase [Nitrospirales bacterium]
MQTTVLSNFDALGLSPTLLKNLAKAGFSEPTAIQAQAIPHALTGRDVLGCAQTGTGKTAAFVIPLLERLSGTPKGQPRALILAPTRELAIQIQATIDTLGRDLQLFATTLVGGADMQAQVRGLRQRPDIIVATPGRLLDHMWNGTVSLLAMTILVLDEADRMLDMGFAPQINQILDAMPEERQTLLFSATMPTDLARLAQASVKNPVRVMVAKPATTADGVAQAVHHTSHDHKNTLLMSMLKTDSDSVLVFARTKHRADRLGRLIEAAGHRVAVLHGGRTLPQRRAALEGFRRGTFRVLVATDIAARGIDVANIGHVINYDVPNCPEDYVHRIGRTARMRTTGRATTFVTAEDHEQMRAIERLLGQAVPRAGNGLAVANASQPEAAGGPRREPPRRRRRSSSARGWRQAADGAPQNEGGETAN